MKKLTVIAAAGVLGGLAYWLTTSSRAFLERARYTVLRQDGDFEVRDYPALPVVTSPMTNADRDGAFRRLFRFIQGENEQQAKIAMTVPVFMDGRTERRSMSFVLPEETAEQGIPHPSVDQVMVDTREASKVAVHRFSGLGSRKNEEKAILELREWVREQGLVAVGEPIIAYYDAPWIPGPLRLNEAMFRLAGD